MLKSKSFFRTTRKGNVVKVVREHYLRDDVTCGVPACKICRNIIPKEERDSPLLNRLSREVETYIIPDTNVILHQIDLMENKALTNIIILQTVLDEVKHQSMNIYKRIREVIADETRHMYVFSNELLRDTYIERLSGESPNDRNDRAIRVATKWYQDHLKPSNHNAMLVTNDKGNMEKAKADGLYAKTIQEYVELLSDVHPILVDMLVDPSASLADEEDKKQNINFPEYISSAKMNEGLKTGKLHQGRIRMARGGFSEGYVSTGTMDHDILIHGADNLNRVVDGDIVAIELLPKSEWSGSSINLVTEDEDPDDENNVVRQGSDKKPSGKVVGIIKRSWKPYPGTIEPPSNTRAVSLLFQPADKRIPKIRIKSRQIQRLLHKRVVVCIDGWDRNSRYPHGHFVRELGGAGDKEAEAQAILLQYDIPFHPFSAAVLKCLPDVGWKAEQEAPYINRRDLRHLDIASVDPPGCVDIDDALHVRQIGDDLYEVGVHIADVTHFVKEGTAIDEEAGVRCTTVYLVDRRIDMLPKELSEDICSLRSGVDRFAFSAIWEMDGRANIKKTEFCKSVIRSVASLSYEQAQNRIDDARQQDNLTKSLRMLLKLSKIMKQRRIDEGAIELASTEVKFKLEQQTKDPTGIEQYQLRETNSMVEEFMLLANVAVAQKIYNHFPSFAILRRHPQPLPHAFDELKEILAKKGFDFTCETSKELTNSLNSVNDPTNPFFNKLVRMLTTRCMSQAVYFSTGGHAPEFFHHFGLAAPIYTHFTSPIRRYADVVVHRLLAASIGYEAVSQDTDNNKVSAISDVINLRHKSAQYAERGSVELHTLLYFRGKTVVEDAYITRVKENGFVVLVPKYGFEGPVFVTPSKDNNPFTYDEEAHTLSYQDITFAVFDKVTVEVSVDESQTHSYKLRLTCVNPVLPKIDNVTSTTPSKKRILSETKANKNNTTKDNKNNGKQENGAQKKKTKVK